MINKTFADENVQRIFVDTLRDVVIENETQFSSTALITIWQSNNIYVETQYIYAKPLLHYRNQIILVLKQNN